MLRLKVRDRIVADGIEDDSFDASDVGQYLKAADVNAMLDDPDALFVDAGIKTVVFNTVRDNAVAYFQTQHPERFTIIIQRNIHPQVVQRRIKAI